MTTWCRRWVLPACGWMLGAMVLHGDAAGGPSGEAVRVMTEWLARQATIQSIATDFVQTRRLKALTEPLVARGRLWFQRPSRFRWELGEPAQTIIVKDSRQLMLVTPRLKRAERYPLDGSVHGPWSDALSLLESGFPKDLATFQRQFQLQSFSRTNGLFELRVQPASPSARRMISRILLVLATNDFQLVANELTLADGSVIRNDFGKPTINPVIDEQVFTPPITSDFKVSEPWKKRP